MSSADPTDEQIAAVLAAQPDRRWNELFLLIGDLGELDQHVDWVPPARAGDSTWTMGYPRYSDAFLAVEQLLDKLKIVTPFRWAEWDGLRRYPQGKGLAAAPVADAVRLCTAYVRGERFADGTLAEAMRDGTLDAIFKRLRAWYDTERSVEPPEIR